MKLLCTVIFFPVILILSLIHILIKADRYFASSKICSVCGKKKEELSLSDRIYYCECGNRMDRDANAAVNIMNEGKRIFAECA